MGGGGRRVQCTFSCLACGWPVYPAVLYASGPKYMNTGTTTQYGWAAVCSCGGAIDGSTLSTENLGNIALANY